MNNLKSGPQIDYEQLRQKTLQIKEAQKKTLAKQLKANRNKVFAINSVQTLQSQIDKLANAVTTNSTLKVDCKPGCSYCCNLRVEVLAPEVFLIARYLKKNLSVQALNGLVTQLRSHATAAYGVTMERFSLQCPLLIGGQCSVYSVRPTMCRKYLSLDVDVCKADSVSLVSGGQRLKVPEDIEMSLKSGAYSTGFVEALKASQFPAQFHELGQALLVALTDDTAEDRWFKKETVFPVIPEQAAEQH